MVPSLSIRIGRHSVPMRTSTFALCFASRRRTRLAAQRVRENAVQRI